MWDETKHPRVPKGNPNGGQFTKGDEFAKAMKKYSSPSETTPSPSTSKHREFTDAKSVDDFFLYDDDRRGILAKKTSAHGVWDKNLTAQQKYSLNDYTSDGYSNINSYLREYDNGEKYSIDFIKAKIKAIDKAIADYYLRGPIITFRSISSEAFSEHLDNIESLIGREYTDKAYMSSSPTLDSTALNKDLLMRIKLPKGKGIGAYINEYNGLKNESEFLIARNSRFLITNAFKKGNIYHLEMELIL